MQQQDFVKKFVLAREWDQYHKPKDLLLNIIEEIGEFRNIIKREQNDDKIKEMIMDNHDEAENFFGDVLRLLCSLGNYCEVDIEKALEKSIEEFKTRFPLEKFKGKYAKKGE